MDPELFKKMQEAALRFRSGESDYEELMTPNGLAVLVRDANDPRGFRIEFVGEGARVSVKDQSYPASETRPHGYPAPLPFLPGCAATIDTSTQSVAWRDPSDPDAAFEHVSTECEEDGWTRLETAREESEEGGDGAGRWAAFEKEGVRRHLRISVVGGVAEVVLTETRPKATK